MTEALPSHINHLPHYSYKPFDFVEQMSHVPTATYIVNAEKRLTALYRNGVQTISNHIDTYELELNTALDTDSHIYKEVSATGHIIDHAKRLISVTNMPCIYGGITFSPVSRSGETAYQAAYILIKNTPASADESEQYLMPIDLADSISLAQRATPDFDPDNLLFQIKGIAEHSKHYRQDSTFQSKTQMEKMYLIEQTAREYTHLLQPYIDQRMPLLIDADCYTIFNPHESKRSEQRHQQNKDPKKRHIIAGRLTEVTFRTLHALNPNVPPLLVIDNVEKNSRYELPLNADIAHIIPLHTTVCR
ncbi:hypothetical protein KC953_02925 [Candidatus Saccharibacteria bacterium]|nr:hypothetical protein [Candidatus Saccharibacteria bacterium]